MLWTPGEQSTQPGKTKSLRSLPPSPTATSTQVVPWHALSATAPVLRFAPEAPHEIALVIAPLRSARAERCDRREVPLREVLRVVRTELRRQDLRDVAERLPELVRRVAAELGDANEF